MLTNGNTPVSQSAAAQRFAKQSAQRAQQGNNADAVQQQSTGDNTPVLAPVFSGGKEVKVAASLNLSLSDYIPTLKGEQFEIIKELAAGGILPDETILNLPLACQLVPMIMSVIPFMDGPECAGWRRSYDYLRSPVLHPILGRIFRDRKEKPYDNGDKSTVYYSDRTYLEVCTCMATVGEYVSLWQRNGNGILSNKDIYEATEVGGMRADGCELFEDFFQKLDKLTFRTDTQLCNWGNYGSMTTGQLSTFLGGMSERKAQEYVFNATRHSLPALFRDKVRLNKSGLINSLNYETCAIGSWFPIDVAAYRHQFNQMLDRDLSQVKLVLSGGDVSSSFIDTYGKMPVRFYVYRRAVSAAS